MEKGADYVKIFNLYIFSFCKSSKIQDIFKLSSESDALHYWPIKQNWRHQSYVLEYETEICKISGRYPHFIKVYFWMASVVLQQINSMVVKKYSKPLLYTFELLPSNATFVNSFESLKSLWETSYFSCYNI